MKSISRWALIILGGIIIALIAMGGVWIGSSIWNGSSKQDMYVGVVGPINTELGKEALNSLRLYAKKNNDDATLLWRIHLIELDDQNLTSAEQQKNLAEIQNKAGVIVGDETSAVFAKNGALAGIQAKIPVILGPALSERQVSDTATTNGSFNISPSEKSEATYLANFVRRVMEQKAVNIVYDSQPEQMLSYETFKRTFIGLGGRINVDGKIDSRKASSDQEIDLFVDKIIRNNDPDSQMVFIATRPAQAVKIVAALRRKGVDFPLVGTSTLSDPTFITELNTLTEERIRPGTFSDNVYAVSPIIFDVAGINSERFEEEYLNFSHTEANAISAEYYDAAMAALDSFNIRDKNKTNQGVENVRQALFAHLTAHTKRTPANGLNGQFYFDKERTAVKTLAFGNYSQQHLVPYFIQLQPVADAKLVKNLDAALASGEIMTVDGEYMYKTNAVYTGISINEIRDINLADNTYKIDFFIWFRYKGEIKDIEKIQFINAVETIKLDEPVDTQTIDGVTFRAYRVVENFKGKFDFRDYPFDSQNLEINFRHQTLTHDQLVFVADHVGMRNITADASDHTIATRPTKANILGGLDGWQAKDVSSFQDIFETDTTLGNPQLFSANTIRQFSRFTMLVQIQRESLAYVFKSLLPLLIVLILAYLALYLPLGHGDRLGAGMSALLTTSVFHLAIASSLPSIGYTIAMEYFFYTAYFLSALLVVFETISLDFERRENEAEGEAKKRLRSQRQRLDLVEKFIYPLVMCVVVGYFINHYGLIARLFTPTTAQAQAGLSANATPTPDQVSAISDRPTVITFGSWRPEDTEQINKLLDEFNSTHSNITVKFVPSLNYDENLKLQLQSNVAPDVFYIHSFSYSRDLFDDGYLDSLNDLAGLNENFSPGFLEAWTTDDKQIYAVPFEATSHGVYYNKDIFNSLGLKEPVTWEEFLQDAQVIRDAGMIPVANGTKEKGSFAEEVFMNLAPNFIGGADGRKAYLSGTRCFNDSHTISAYQAIADLAPFLPSNRAQLLSNDSKQLFITKKAAMMFGGSWDISKMQKEANFDWSVFPVPAPAGHPIYVTFHTDVGVALNKASLHKKAARTFLEWLTTPQANQILTTIPGLFPMHKNSALSTDQIGNIFLSWNQKYQTDVRWAYPVLAENEPNGPKLMEKESTSVAEGSMTPLEAANDLQSGLAQWFEPAQQACGSKP